jgi:hypothetical protein
MSVTDATRAVSEADTRRLASYRNRIRAAYHLCHRAAGLDWGASDDVAFDLIDDMVASLAERDGMLQRQKKPPADTLRQMETDMRRLVTGEPNA